jgi:hypothetical protein
MLDTLPRTRRPHPALVLLCLALMGCTTLAPASGSETPTGNFGPAAQPPTVGLTLRGLQNAEYHSPDWGDFRLVEGVYSRTPSDPGASATYSTQLIQPVIYGDLNGDGIEDAAVILTTQNGGTGHFRELAAVLNRGGAAYNVDTVSLGDRVVVETGRIEADIIVLSMRVQGPNDGMCCPSLLVTWRFRLQGDRLMKLR